MNMLKLLAVSVVLSISSVQGGIVGEDKAAPAGATQEQVDASRAAELLLKTGLESNDAILLLAAGKMMSMSGNLALLKDEADADSADLADDKIWHADEVYRAAAKAAGKNSALGKQALALAAATNPKADEANACYYGNHYHDHSFWYDRYGVLHWTRTWHTCG